MYCICLHVPSLVQFDRCIFFFLWRENTNMEQAVLLLWTLDHTKLQIYMYIPYWVCMCVCVYIDTHTHLYISGRTPLKERSACRKGHYIHNTQQTQQTDIHSLCGIRNLNPISPAAWDLRFRLLGHTGWITFVQ
jgi:hypothetical protein